MAKGGSEMMSQEISQAIKWLNDNDEEVSVVENEKNLEMIYNSMTFLRDLHNSPHFH